MLVVSLPNGAASGECKIHRRLCDFKIEGTEFWFRSKEREGSGWGQRRIFQTNPNGREETYYVCSRVMDEGPIG
jgi:hypothetical protein